MADVAMTIRVGASAGRFRAQDSRASEYFADRVAEEALGSARSQNVIRVRDLERRLTRTVQSELEKAVKYATDNMIGLKSTLNQDTHFRFGRHIAGGMVGISRTEFVRPPREFGTQTPLTWHPLTSSTRLAKGSAKRPPRPNAHKHFLNTGALRRNLRRNAQSIVQGTGVVRFEVLRQGAYRPITRKTEFVNVGTLRVTFLPRIHKSFLPGLHTGSVTGFDPSMRFEGMVVRSNAIFRKLRGPTAGTSMFQRPEWHRPLLQPVFTYWTLFRLPQRVTTVLDKIIGGPRASGRTD